MSTPSDHGPLFGYRPPCARRQRLARRRAEIEAEAELEELGYGLKFDQWMRDNVELYDSIVRRAVKAKRMGIDRWAIKSLIEIVRWDRAIKKQSYDFKINNNLAPYLARHIMSTVAELADFFETRESKS